MADTNMEDEVFADNEGNNDQGDFGWQRAQQDSVVNKSAVGGATAGAHPSPRGQGALMLQESHLIQASFTIQGEKALQVKGSAGALRAKGLNAWREDARNHLGGQSERDCQRRLKDTKELRSRQQPHQQQQQRRGRSRSRRRRPRWLSSEGDRASRSRSRSRARSQSRSQSRSQARDPARDSSFPPLQPPPTRGQQQHRGQQYIKNTQDNAKAHAHMHRKSRAIRGAPCGLYKTADNGGKD
ncbi:serine/Arginine-related protein 53-like [Dermacentor albipictus]|uniref:serine/Arginine-related protein 53-like n=1 Tax=Dermacentor albipictus TaxID=60249 RepID=UPI0038FD0A0B